MKNLANLLFITHQTEQYSYLDSIKLALAGGCQFIQLRMKDASDQEITQVAQDARRLCLEAGAILLLDDRVDLCHRLGLDGVHLGKQDMLPSKARLILGDEALIGGTANSFEDILHLIEEGVDYIGLGPFRYTTTKKRLSPILGMEGYQQIMTACRENGITLPIYAIGGISQADIPLLLQTGVWGISLSSAILGAVDPVIETKTIIHCIDKNHEKINYSR